MINCFGIGTFYYIYVGGVYSPVYKKVIYGK